MQCAHPVWIKVKTPVQDPRTLKLSDSMQVPCGKCMPCRIRRRSEWAVRLYHELSFYESASFVTLTYNDVVLPPNGSLVKRDLQLYHKRLRKALSDPIKYYAVGEYGSQTDRPHYHGIYFGLGVDQDQIVKDCWLSDCRIKLGTVTFDSIQYVTGYIEDKLYGELADEYYTSRGREPPFSLMSRGLGLRFAERWSDQILDRGVTIHGNNMGIPRYYQRKLGIAKIDKVADVMRHADRVKRHYGSDKSPIQLFDILDSAHKQNELNIKAKLCLKAEKKLTKL